MSEFLFQPAFKLEVNGRTEVSVSVTFKTSTGKAVSVTFSDPDRDQMVTVPFDLWSRVVAAVAHTEDWNESV